MAATTPREQEHRNSMPPFQIRQLAAQGVTDPTMDSLIRSKVGAATAANGSEGANAEAYRALEEARASGDSELIGMREHAFDAAVERWREATKPEPTPAPDFGAGARGSFVQQPPSMSQKIRADAWGVEPDQLPNPGGI